MKAFCTQHQAENYAKGVRFHDFTVEMLRLRWKVFLKTFDLGSPLRLVYLDLLRHIASVTVHEGEAGGGIFIASNCLACSHFAQKRSVSVHISPLFSSE
ncbi:MAG TPA: hypothetical protein PK971_16120, partial [Saprospiraceae bacterium]|nr:hypothetical protein [Saprospiraceae bacterium]